MMGDDNPGKHLKNSLLSAASSGFSFEDSALLVPVALNDEPTLVVSEEIDLNSDDQEQNDGTVILQGYSSQEPEFSTHSSQRPFTTPSNLTAQNVEKSSKIVAVAAEVETAVAGTTSIPLFSLFSTPTSQSSLSTKVNEFLHQDWSNLSQTPFLPQPPSASSQEPLKTTLTTLPREISPQPLYSSTSPSSIASTYSVNTSSGIPSVVPMFKPNNKNVTLPSTTSGMLSSMDATPSAAVFSPNIVTQTTTPLVSFFTPISVASSVDPSNFFQPNFAPQIQPVADFDAVSQSRPPPPIAPPTPSSVGAKANNFRLGNQRPMYAKYPGLSGSSVSDPQPLLAMEAPPTYGNAAPPVPLTMFSSGTMPMATPFNVVDGGISESPFSAASANNMYHNPSSTTGYQPGTMIPNQSIPVAGYYKPLTFHWFHRKDVDGRAVWRPFSTTDSAALEQAFIENKSELVASDGGRYDVDVHKRLKYPVYWEENPSEVRRCSWFYKGPMDSRFVPYEEDLSERLEAEYYEGMTSGIWNRRLEFSGGEAIILYNPNAVSHFCQAAAPDEWGNLPESQLRPRVVKRSIEEFEIEEGESTQIDHLVFLVHGIGAICDFKLRTIVEAVDDFRHLSFQLMHTHFKEAVDSQRAGRIEFLPVSWHKALHGEGGIDQKLKPITLKSIPKLRNFTNDTLLDILFYTSPVYAQTIVETVGNELNRLYKLFLSRNPTFNGYVALSGHSLGSLILFDLLAHQPPPGRETKNTESESSFSSQPAKDNVETGSVESDTSNSSKMVSYTIGSGTGRPFIKYPTLEFEPTAFFALGSPIAMFVTVRGCDSLGENFHFPTCPAFFNIFHPFDPVAYRIETLIDPSFDMRPVIIPHHKGRKRFHLELKETMQRVGADIKQKFLDSLKTTWNTVYQYATFSKGDNLEKEIDRVIEGEFGSKSVDTNSNGSGEDDDQDIGMGKLNGGRRIDYVLQEAPLESFNEYLFALSSHVCYWESEDTMLMVMREVYASMGIFVEQKSQSEQQFSNNLPSAPAVALRDNGLAYNQNSAYMASQPLSSQANYAAFSAATASPSYGNPLEPAISPSAPSHLFVNSSASTASQANPQPFMPFSAPSNNQQGKPTVIGARPVVAPEALSSLRGMDPTQPIMSSTPIGPPPLTGFQRKK